MSVSDDYSYIELEDNHEKFESDFKSFLLKFELNLCAILAITQNTSIRIAAVKLDDDLIVDYSFPEFFNFITHKNNLIYHAFDTEKVSRADNDSGVEMYFQSTKFEMAIPVKINRTTIGCIIIGSDRKIEETVLSELNTLLLEYRYYLNDLEKEKIINKNVIRFVVMLDKIYSKNNELLLYHSYNVASLSTEIAVDMGYNETKVRRIYLAALLHDIGCIYIDSEIVNKQGKYSDEEYKKLKRHVEYGFNICKDLLLGYNENMALWIKQHHEKWDGTGYPGQLVGEEISEEARIIKVADAVDSMLSYRNYKVKMGTQQAINELKKCSGSDFDPNVIDVAVSILCKKLNFENHIIEEFILPANLIFDMKDFLISLNGYISKANEDLVFYTDEDIEKVIIKDSISTVLSIERSNIITEYKVAVKKTSSASFIIKKIEEKEQDKTFSLQWILDGFLIDKQKNEAKKIIINRLSAKGFTFSVCDNDLNINLNGTYSCKIIFEDKSEINLLGKPYRYVRINNSMYYELVFININDSLQTQIFHQLFEKQISIRNMLK